MNVEALRKELKLRPEEFAKALGVSSGYAADLRSKRRQPSLRVAAQLEKLTGKPIVAEFVAIQAAKQAKARGRRKAA